MSTTEVILTNAWEDHNGNTSKDKDTNISENLAAIASKELREEENVRKQCLAHIREWIKQNPDIENCITGNDSMHSIFRDEKRTEKYVVSYLIGLILFKNCQESYMVDILS